MMPRFDDLSPDRAMVPDQAMAPDDIEQDGNKALNYAKKMENGRG